MTIQEFFQNLFGRSSNSEPAPATSAAPSQVEAVQPIASSTAQAGQATSSLGAGAEEDGPYVAKKKSKLGSFLSPKRILNSRRNRRGR